ncbi:exosome complex RNA-binding protein Rrp4 [Halobacteriota archaeon]
MKLVIPGDLLSDDVKRAGEGTYVANGGVYASIYGILDSKELRVIPMFGKYIPHTGDIVIGKVVDISFSNWIIDINSPYEALLHISEHPDRIYPFDMGRFLDIGDLFIAKVKDIDATMRVDLMLENFSPLRNGRVIEISHTRIPRVIGRGGSMINLLKKELDCSIFVGQNGRILVHGEEDNMDIAIQTLLKIESESHTPGLTDLVREMIITEKKGKEEISHD